MNPREEHPPLESLSAFVDKELEAAEVPAVEAHLGLCTACAGRVDDLRRLSGGVAGEAVPPLPLDLASRLAERLDAYEAGSRPRVSGAFRIHRPAPALRPWRWSGAPLAAAAAILAGGLLWRFWLAVPGPVSPLQLPPAPPATAESAKPRQASEMQEWEMKKEQPQAALRRVMAEPQAAAPALPAAAPPATTAAGPTAATAAGPPATAMAKGDRGMAALESSGPAPAFARDEAIGQALSLREGDGVIRLYRSGRLEVTAPEYVCAVDAPQALPEESWRRLLAEQEVTDARDRVARNEAVTSMGAAAGSTPPDSSELRDLLLRLVRIERRQQLESACGPLPAALAGSEAD